MDEVKIKISLKQLELAEKVATGLQKSIGNKEPWTSMRSYLEPTSRRNYVAQVESSLGISLKEKKILEVGSGMGMFVVVSNKLGLDVTGIEPCANSYTDLNEAMNELLSQNGLPLTKIQRESGEELPFANNSFDVVLAFQVLEHVADPSKTLNECIRVLKPGGKLFMDMPNYFSFVEAHYGIVWCPLLSLFSKKVARVYVKMHSRNPDFLNELNFITPWRIRKWLKNKNVTFSITPPPDSIPETVSVKDTTFKQELPQGFSFKSAQRFSKFGRWVRQTINNPGIKKLLFKLDMMDHIVLTAEKK